MYKHNKLYNQLVKKNGEKFLSLELIILRFLSNWYTNMILKTKSEEKVTK